MSGAYMIALLVSLGGLAFIDYRLRLAFFKHAKRTALILLITIGFFVLWDIAGILSNIFFIGQTTFLLGIRIGQFPLEELFFLTLLNYTSLLVYLMIKRQVERT